MIKVKETKLIYYSLVFLLIGCSKPKKEKTIALKQIFKTDIFDNGSNKFNSRIALNDSVIMFKSYVMAKAAGFIAVDSSIHIFVKGKSIVSGESFETLLSKYHAKEINLDVFVSENQLPDKFKKLRHLNKQSIHDGKVDDFVQITPNILAEVIDIAGPEISVILKDENIRKAYKIRSLSEVEGVVAKGYDINNDGKKELFLISHQISYWGASWTVDIYEVINSTN